MGLTFANYVIKPFFPICKCPDLAVRLVAGAAICKFKFENNLFGFEGWIINSSIWKFSSAVIYQLLI